jgi:Protein of unknown function (DUF2799)
MRAIAVASVCVALYLTGCASMSKDECRVVDWRTIGYEDGVAGRASDSIGRYRKACASAGVTPDLDAYRAGRAEGLREYCQPQNGFRAGAHGADYAGFCPSDLAPAFTRAYDSGLELHARKHRLNEATSRLASAHSEIESLEHQMVSNSSVVLAKDGSSEARAQALLETTQLAERHQHLQDSLPQLEQDKWRCEHDLEEYETRLASWR